ncbi:hypothetical protein C1645_766127 [Glomus cerebriforme]|uniref:Uncharacterized protein n=1 Tax=Glomus cerebriforme TaxID=658196 RepID=A0A397T3W2_9GLOM|nr:hypothetical protein C1645_766127 [Glomus cerebriforme]
MKEFSSLVLFKNILEKRIISRFLTTKSISQNDSGISGLTNNHLDEYDEILKTYQIPGRYLHYFKKNGSRLKKESQFSDEDVTRITARKLRSEHIIITNIDNNDKVNDNPSKGLSNAQQNIVQRLYRAIIKCNDDVPHNHLTSTFFRIMNITVSPDLNIARVWWKPDPQKGISEVRYENFKEFYYFFNYLKFEQSNIENTLNKYSIKYRNILQRAMHMRNPPKIVFLRYDKVLGSTNKLLDKIEEDLKAKGNEILISNI